jgi:hypothetical protein
LSLALSFFGPVYSRFGLVLSWYCLVLSGHIWSDLVLSCLVLSWPWCLPSRGVGLLCSEVKKKP